MSPLSYMWCMCIAIRQAEWEEFARCASWKILSECHVTLTRNFTSFVLFCFVFLFRRKSATAESLFDVCLLRTVGAFSKIWKHTILNFIFFHMFIRGFTLSCENTISELIVSAFIFFPVVFWGWKGIIVCACRCVCRWQIVREVKSQLLWHWNSLCNLLSCLPLWQLSVTKSTKGQITSFSLYCLRIIT